MLRSLESEGRDTHTRNHRSLPNRRLILASRSYIIKSAIAGYEFRQPIEYYLATELAERFRLRALGILHVAYASLLKKTKLVDIFITGDEEIIEQRGQIHKATEVLVKHPREITKQGQ